MKRAYNFSIIFLMILYFCATCSPKVQKSSFSFEELIREHHTVVAVLPFIVSADKKRLSEQTILGSDPNKLIGYAIQNSVYLDLLGQFGRKIYQIEFQDVEKTNMLLRNNRIGYEKLMSQNKIELCRSLGVDAVILGNIHSSEPLFDESELKPDLNNREDIPNKSNVSLKIYNQQEGKLLWQYDYTASTIVGNNARSLMSIVMKNVSLKFPRHKK